MDLESVVAQCSDVAWRVLDGLDDVVYLVSGVKCETEDADDVGHEGNWTVGRGSFAVVVAGVERERGRLPPIYPTWQTARFRASLPHEDAREAVTQGAAGHFEVNLIDAANTKSKPGRDRLHEVVSMWPMSTGVDRTY